MKVFLTGGTGFIGRPLARALLGRGWEVVALARRPEGPQAAALAAMGARVVPGDILDAEAMRAPMRGADLLIHNAAWYEVGVDRAARTRMREINVTGTDIVLGLAEDLSVPRGVYVSSVVALGETGADPVDESYRRMHPCRSFYEQTKTDGHELALDRQRRGLPLAIACPGMVIGPNDHAVWGYFLRMYLHRMLPPIGWAGDVVIAMVHVDDVAEGIALTAEKGRMGETYLLAGNPLRVRDVFDFWARRPGGILPRLWLPKSLVAPMLAPLEPVQRLLGVSAFMSRETVAAATNLNYDSGKARRELGWTTRSAADMWMSTIDGEIELMKRRSARSLAARLNPIEG